MLNIGEMVKIKHNNKIDVILSQEEISGKYVVFTQDEITPISLFAEQIENVTFESKLTHERKWQNELKDKFGEKFVHIDGDKLRYCINECYLDEEWPDEYAKCIIPYSLFDEAIVNGTAEGGLKKIKKNCYRT